MDGSRSSSDDKPEAGSPSSPAEGTGRREPPSVGGPAPPGTQNAMGPWTLRFTNPQQEAFFVKMQSETVLRNFRRLCSACVVVTVALSADMARVETRGDAAMQIKAFALAACLCAMAVFALAVVLSTLELRCGSLRAPICELLAAVWLALFSASPFIIDWWYVGKLLGHDPKQVWPRTSFSDTRALLSQIAFAGAAQLALPIRWSVLLPMQVFPVALYAGCNLVVGGPEGNLWWRNFIIFSAVVVVMSIGRRTIEIHQRLSFRQVVEERSRRAQTEFQLSQLEEGGWGRRAARSDAEEDKASTRESLPETTDTGRAFQEGRIEAVVDIGRHEQWYIKPDEVVLQGRVLGEGGFGVVHAATFHGTPVAVKQPKVDLQGASSSNSAMVSAINELRILRRLRHPNIVLFYGACLDLERTGITIVLELVNGQSLTDFVSGSHLQWRDRVRAITDTCWALQYLHSRQPPVIHGDLKDSNIFVELDPSRPGAHRVKLLDFGLSRVLTKHVRRLGGSLMWAAPEVVNRNIQGAFLPAADVFSFGRLAFFVLTGSYPFAGRHQQSVIRILKSGNIPPLAWPSGAGEPCGDQLRRLVEQCGAYEASARPSIEEAGAHLNEVGAQLDGSTSGSDFEDPAGLMTGQPLPPVPEHQGVMAPGYMPTPEAMQRIVLLDAMRRCNFAVARAARGGCCGYHTSLEAVRSLVDDMSSRPQHRDLHDDAIAQCHECGVLLYREDEEDGVVKCFFCLTEIKMRSGLLAL